MKKLTVAIIAAFAATAWAQTYVKPHIRKDGTFVDGHFKSKPNATVDDNYSTKGNFNPYTGEKGSQPKSFERPYEDLSPPKPLAPTCGYTATGRYVCR